MSIFNNIKNTSKTEELDLLIQLKYGEPNHTAEYFDKLPEAVITNACRKTSHKPSTVHIQKQVLAILLRQPTNRAIALKALHESLVEYHTLLGTM